MSNNDVYILLIITFLFYVIGDYITTIRVIDETPLGINGEINPIAVMLYVNYGNVSLLIAKLVMFAILTTITIWLLNKDKYAKSVIKKVLICFSIFSILIVGINTYTILTIQFLK